MTDETKQKETTEENPRGRFAALVAGLKDQLSRKQEELDAEGVERKELTPEMVDAAQMQLTEALPDLSEDMLATILQVFADVMATPGETDVEDEVGMVEEAAMDDGEEEKQDEKVAALMQQVADMGKAYNELIGDMSDVVRMTQKAFEQMNAETKQYNDFNARIKALEKQYADKPRRASQSPETEVDPASETAKNVKAKQVTIPSGYEAFPDLFKKD